MADRAKRDASPKTAGSRPEDRRLGQGRLAPQVAISRRKFIQGAVAVSAVAGAAAAPAKAWGGLSPAPALDARNLVDAGTKTRAYQVLTPEQGRVLTAVLNRIVPATDGMPGAGDVGIARFVDGVLVDAPHLRPPIASLLHAADAGERFANLNEVEQDARLREVSRREKASFDTLLRAAYTGYYSEPRVLAALGRGPRSDPRGPTASFDTGLLDAVRRRGPIYRSVSTPHGGAS